MESANSHHHHHHLLQDQLVGSSASSSSAATPSYYGEGTTPHAWSTTTPTSFLNTNNGFTLYTSEPILNSRSEPRPQENTLLSSQYSSNMVPDLGFHNWANATNNFTASQSVHNFQLPRTKDEISDHYYRKYADILSSNEPKILMNKNMNQLSSGDLPYASNTGRGFSQIFPSINVSDLSHQMGLANASGSLDMNLEALDLLTSSSFSGNLGTSSSSQNQIGILRDGFSNYGAFDEHMPQSNHIPLYASNKISSSPVSMGAVESKRSSGKMEPKAPLQNAMKKSRVEARASCPPFKVRKEKLGDRIAALQQMVAPFGKTDTASVLMEAIGYIKFLQDQVETLSVPYMKASRNKSGRVIKTGHADENEMEEPKRDLKSRGLCLVPLSCLSYIDDGGGAAVWPPPHFGGAN